MAAIDLLTDPAWNRVEGVTGVLVSLVCEAVTLRPDYFAVVNNGKGHTGDLMGVHLGGDKIIELIGLNGAGCGESYGQRKS